MTSSADFMNMQINLKHNQTELADFMSELQSWETDIKQKDEVIKSIATGAGATSSGEGGKMGGTGDGEQSRPPVRNIATKPKVEKKAVKEDLKDEESPKKQKIKSYDYRAWDKFDVDKECEKIESESAKNENKESELEENDEEKVAALLRQRERQKASFYKEQGNKCLKNGKLNDAIIYYTKGIEADPNNALLYSNRAMANLKLGKNDLVIDDCTESIKLDDSYFKSYLRRASAYRNLGQVEQSEQDFRTVLKLQPDNKEALNELNKLKLVKENKSGIANTNNIVMPVKKSIGKRSKVPLRRIHVEEIRSSENLSSNLGAQANFIKTKETKPSKSKVIEIASDITESKTESQKFDAVESNWSTPLNDSADKTTEDTSSRFHKLNENLEAESPKSDNHVKVKSKEIQIPPVPMSSMQFIADWKQLHKNQENTFLYLKQIPSQKLTSLIPHSAFDSTMLTTFLQVFKNYFVLKRQPEVFPYLAALSKVKRFSTLTMFLSKEEKQVVKELFEFVERTETVSIDQISSVKKLYSM